MDSERRLIKKSEIVIILMVLCVMLVIFMLTKRQTETTAIVSLVDGNASLTLDLNTDKTYKLNEINSAFPNVEIETLNGYVYVKNSDCHDKVCEKTGKINSKYQSIVCLPNKLVVYIVKDNTESNIDVVI